MIWKRLSRHWDSILLVVLCASVLVGVLYWPTEDDPAIFTVPDGSPTRILTFVKKLENHKVDFRDQKHFDDYIQKVNRAFIEAADKILAQNPEDRYVAAAIEIKLGAMTMLAAHKVGNAPKEALELVQKLRTDKRRVVAKIAEEFWTPIRIHNISSMSFKEQSALVDEVVEAVDKSNFEQRPVTNATTLGSVLVKNGSPEDAAELYDVLAQAAANHRNPNLRPQSLRFEGMARFLRLPGNKMELEGKLLSGEQLDWESYRGKVVLVDYWATWCKPCLMELPNVKENYKKYHDKGFEVVAVNLDDSRSTLERFVKNERIPWPQLFDATRGTGWNHPMVLHYAISSVPMAILVGKDGKVVSTQAQGPELSKLLKKLLDSPAAPGKS